MRQQKISEAQKADAERAQQATEEAARQAELLYFERTQTNFNAEKSGGRGTPPVIEGNGPTSPTVDVGENGVKTTGLPSFWVPSLTPAAAPDIIKTPKTETMCTASEQLHPVTIRKLISVKFTEPKGTKGEYVCPSCTKTFTNGSKIVVVKGCGHAICKECCSKFVKPSEKCMVCEKKCSDKDLINLRGE
ncbi:hypothetical protein HK097_000232, partial [Rhizophlyctis rosea]